MLIKYTENLILDIDVTTDIIEVEDQETEITAERITESYTVSDIAVDKSTNSYYALVEGNLQLFKDNNLNLYLLVDDIPVSSTIMYFVDEKYGTPSSTSDFFKHKARERINSDVGDIYDIVTDLSKRIVIIERLGVFLANELIEGDLAPSTHQTYGTFINSYYQNLTAAGGVTDLADLEDPMELFTKLFSRTMEITNIVKEEYINKKISLETTV